MAPKVETNVVGRHGIVGQDILSHDPDLHMPVDIGQEFADMVDEMDRRVKETLAREQQLTLEAAREKTSEVVSERVGHLAVLSVAGSEAA